jgi:hypothetical protein
MRLCGKLAPVFADVALRVASNNAPAKRWSIGGDLEVGSLLGPKLEPVTALNPGSGPNHGQSSIVGETRPLQGRWSGPVGTSALSLGSPERPYP